jgi:hypothetical protein
VSGQNEEGVEPSSGLIDSLGDKVGREVLLELLLVLEWVVRLRVGHPDYHETRAILS